MRRLVAAAALIATALVPATARAGAYTDVLHVYQADGSVPPCRFSSPQLAAALKGIDTYGQQYFADFTQAVQTALAERASGACTPAAGTHAHALPVLASRTPLPGSVTSPTDANVPAPILAMAVIVLLAGLVVGVRALAGAFGWEPAWAAAWRHAWGEAAYRAGAGLGEFADWLRSGR